MNYANQYSIVSKYILGRRITDLAYSLMYLLPHWATTIFITCGRTQDKYVSIKIQNLLKSMNWMYSGILSTKLVGVLSVIVSITLYFINLLSVESQSAVGG